MGREREALWKELQSAQAANADDLPDLDRISWIQALQWKAGHNPELDVDDWQEREAKKIIEALEKHNITAMLIKDPEITAIALQNLLPNVTARLTELWGVDDDDDEYEVEVEEVMDDFA